MKPHTPILHGIPIKKQFGQHFLREYSVIDRMLQAVTLTPQTSIFEIGCGDGFLTQAILQQPCERLWVFEIDHQWAAYVRKLLPDKRLTIFEENILEVDFARFEEHKPWTLLANLPYNVTFPILHKLQQNRHLLKEGVVMVQEEVAQKIVKSGGRDYGFISLFMQHYFTWKLLTKIAPGAFVPPPKVDSRLLYFTPRTDAPHIPNEEEFWRWIKICFKQPRRTLKNNLAQGHYAIDRIPEEMLAKRAQQLGMQEFLYMWQLLQ